MLKTSTNVHNNVGRLYKNFGICHQQLMLRKLTLPKVNLCKPYMAYVGRDKATVMITADGKTSNHILFLFRFPWADGKRKKFNGQKQNTVAKENYTIDNQLKCQTKQL